MRTVLVSRGAKMMVTSVRARSVEVQMNSRGAEG